MQDFPTIISVILPECSSLIFAFAFKSQPDGIQELRLMARVIGKKRYSEKESRVAVYTAVLTALLNSLNEYKTHFQDADPALLQII